MWQNGDMSQVLCTRGLHVVLPQVRMEPWALHSQGTIAIASVRCGGLYSFSFSSWCSFFFARVYADDLAVAALSFRGFMISLAPALRSVDHIAGLNLNYRKCC